MTAYEPRVVVDVYAEGTTPSLAIREIAAGGVDNPVHRAAIGIYTNPPQWFTATVSMTGGVGIEPPVYSFLGDDYTLGEKRDAQIAMGGQTYTAGQANPLVLNAWRSLVGTLRSSNAEQTVSVHIDLDGGLGSYVEQVDFLPAEITLVMPDMLFPETPDTTSVTLQLGGTLPRLVPGHEVLFFVNGLTFPTGKHLDWLTDAYLKNKPDRLEWFVQVRTDYNAPEYEQNITEITNDDGFASATITIVEPLLGIDHVEVKVLDGSVYLD
jgi:hypothetical protein